MMFCVITCIGAACLHSVHLDMDSVNDRPFGPI